VEPRLRNTGVKRSVNVIFCLLIVRSCRPHNRKGTPEGWNKLERGKRLALDRNKWKTFTKAICSTQEQKERRRRRRTRRSYSHQPHFVSYLERYAYCVMPLCPQINVKTIKKFG
jgi:hypothetical protein